MKKQFDKILDFTKVKEKCFFCNGALRPRLVNFLGLRKSGLPIINSAMENNRFTFTIKHTTENYDIEAEGRIDARTNGLVFLPADNSETPFLDQQVIKQVFDDLWPHIELYCCNKQCKYHYYLASYKLETFKLNNINAFMVGPGPVKLFIEQFQTGNSIVINDWMREKTSIYSSTNEDADPLITPLIDFEEMGCDKLLTRIGTIVTYS